MNVRTRDLYAILDVLPAATAEEIEAAFRRLALENHPDKVGEETGGAIMRDLNRARLVLRDPDLRAAYDRWRKWAWTNPSLRVVPRAFRVDAYRLMTSCRAAANGWLVEP